MSEDGDTSAGLIIPVSCGAIEAKLWMERFICPGIHQQCIEVNGEMMTPKAFCVMGAKEKLKDWKNAIRINGRSIRKRMDIGDIDFYKHNEICTGRCMSRSYGNSKYDVKIENLSQNDSAEWPTPLVRYDSPPEGAMYNILQGVTPESALPKTYTTVGHVVFPGMESVESPSASDSGVYIKQEQCSDEDESLISAAQDILQNSSIPIANSSSISCVSESSVTAMQSSKTVTKHRRKKTVPHQVPSSNRNLPNKMNNAKKPNTNGAMSLNATNIVKLVSEFPDSEVLLEDSVVFWQNISEMGLLDEIVRDAKHCLDNIKNDMCREGITEGDARKLSDVINSLGLITKVKWRMAEHKMRTESEKEQLLHEIEALKKKVMESEVKRQALKRRSDCFDSLVEMKPKIAAVDSLLDMSKPHLATVNSLVETSKPQLAAVDSFVETSKPQLAAVNSVVEMSKPKIAAVDGLVDMSQPQLAAVTSVVETSNPQLAAVHSVVETSKPKLWVVATPSSTASVLSDSETMATSDNDEQKTTTNDFV